MGVLPTRPWLRRIAIGGAVLAGLGYYLYRTRTPSTSDTSRMITERHVGAFLVRRRIDPTRVEAVRNTVSEAVSEDEPRRLLGIDGATTATLFLETGDEPALVWYVEVPQSTSSTWADPEATVANAFPIEHDALDEAELAVDRELLVHAVNPDRPHTATGREDGGLVASETELDAGETVDVSVVRMPLKSGLPERFADWFAGICRRVEAGELELGPVETWSAEMLDAEEMYTESLFLERNAEGYVLWQYMEAAEMEQVYDAYYDTANPVARVAEFIVGQVLEEPEQILSLPLGTDAEPLAHAVEPDRPRRIEEC
ncbi:hypothetical protein ACLI4Z_17950 [Natrialbaceae archaeon A-arb3/5]